MTWTLVKGHKGPVKGLRASGPLRARPIIYSLLTYSARTCHPVDLYCLRCVVLRRSTDNSMYCGDTSGLTLKLASCSCSAQLGTSTTP
jgi:hypothetical protein